MTWKRADSEETSWEEIKSILRDLSHSNYKIVVGSDSQPFRCGIVVVTAICIISDSVHHRRYFYQRRKEVSSNRMSLYERLYSETMASIKVADEIKDCISSASIEIHLDVSPESSRHQTSRYASAMTSLVRGFAYSEVEIKPNSWGASSVADKYTKNW
tara:strand:+ start:231 stop:704 length:474 start_codon:yes stop_codon:yes gene_type:complete